MESADHRQEPADHRLEPAARRQQLADHSLQVQVVRSLHPAEHKGWTLQEADRQADMAMQRGRHTGSRPGLEAALESAVQHKG